MSQSIDERVVYMRFDNRQFEAGVDQTLKDVEKLNKGLKFEGASKGLEGVNKEIEKLDVSGFEKSLDAVVVKMQTLGTIGMTIVSRLTNAVIDFGKKTVDAFAIEPVTTGFNEYELKMGSVQTIMNATGASVQTVNKYLDELNEYSDRTIYSFADMTSNIGKFTNAGVNLKDAVAAIKGVSNEAALAGANANEASRAMYNFAQALATGSVKLIDWKSIENANMATVSFKEELLKTAEEMGTVKQDANGMYQVLTKNAGGASMKTVMNATRSFNDSLSYQWMTSEILIETLKKYSDETTQIGKDAYAAAQDVKTFSMMVETLKEAAQSGWAETWQLVTGDFEEAKKTWTTFTSFFDEIISRSAKARNELISNAMRLQNDDGLTGREALWQSLLNILEAVRNILGAVKQAWTDVFPPITDQKIRGIIESFKNFTERLKENTVLVENIRKIFTGLFNLLDAFIVIVRVAFHVGVIAVKNLLNALENLFFFGFGVLVNWLKKVETAETGFNGWVNGIIKGVKRFIDYVTKLDGLTLTNVINTMGSFVTNVIGSVFNFDAIVSIFNEVGSKISGFFAKISGSTSKATSEMKTSGNGLIDWLIEAKDKIVEIFNNLTKNITINTVIGASIGIGLTLIVITFKKFLDSITGVFDGIKKTFSSLSDVLSAKAKQIKASATATLLLSIAGSILMLVASLAVLVSLTSDPDRFLFALSILAVLIAGVVGAMFALTKIDNKKSVSFAAVMVAFGVAMISLANTLKIIQAIPTEGLGESLIILLVLLGELLAVGMLIGSARKQYTVGATTLIGFAIALSLMVDALVKINNADLKYADESMAILLTLVGSLAVLGFAFRGVRLGAAFTMLASVLVISQIMKVMAKFAEIDTTSITNAISAITSVFYTFAGLMVVAGLMTTTLDNFSLRLKGGLQAGFKANDSLKQLGNAMLAMASSILIIVLAFKMIGNLDDSDITRSLDFIKGVSLCFGALIAVSILSGKNADKAGKMLTKMASAILKLSLVMIALSLFTDSEDLKTPLRVISQLMLIMVAIVAATAFVPNVENIIDVFKGIAIAVAAMGAVLLVLSLLRNDNMKEITVLMSALMLVFGAVVAASGLAKDSHKTILMMTIAMVAMAALLVVLSELELKNSIENASSIGIMLLSLAGSLAIINKASNAFNGKSLGMLTILIAIMGVLAVGISWLEKHNFSVSIQNAVALGVLILALSKALSFLDGVTVSLETVGSLAMMAGVLAILGLIIGFFENAFTTLDGPAINVSIQNAISLGLLILALSASVKLLNDVKIDSSITSTLIIMGLVLMGIMAVIALLGLAGISSLSISIENAISLGLLMLALGASIKLLNNTNIDSSVVPVIATMGIILAGLMVVLAIITGLGGEVKLAIDVTASLSLLLLALSASVKLLNNTKMDKSVISVIVTMGLILGGLMAVIALITKYVGEVKLGIETALSLSVLLIGLSVACRIVSTMHASVLDAINGVLALGIFIVAIGALMWGIGHLVNENPHIMEDLDVAIQVFEKIGEVIGSIIGGFLTGILGNGDMFKRIGEDIAAMVNAIAPALETLKSVDPATTENLKNLMTAILMLTANEALSKITSFLLGENSMEKFADGMEALGEGLKSFTGKIADMTYDENKVDYALQVLRDIITISKSIPNSGGVLGFLLGNNDIGDFAAQFETVADGICAFTGGLVGMEYISGKVDYGLKVLRDIIKISKSVPNSGGVLGFLLGNNDIGDFAKQFGDVADGITTFCNKLIPLEFSQDKTDAGLYVMEQLIELSQKVPNQDAKWIKVLFGSSNMDDFAAQFPTIGQGIAGFCSAIYAMYYQKEKTEGALGILDRLVSIADTNSNSKGWMAIYVDDKLVEKFGEYFPFIGKGISEFCSAIRGMQAGDESNATLSMNVLEILVQASKNVQGLNVENASKMKNFALELTWVGSYLLNYSKQIDAIKDLGVVEKSAEIILSLSELASAARYMDYDKFDKFQTAILEFARNTVAEFTKIFESTDKKEIASVLTEGIASEIHKKADLFSKEATFIVNTFIAGIKIKMNDLTNIGRDMGNTFLIGLRDSLDERSPSRETTWAGEMAVAGFAEGLANQSFYELGSDTGTDFLNGFCDRMGIHSNAWEMIVNGLYTMGGLAQGIDEGDAQVQNSMANSITGMTSQLTTFADNAKEIGKEVVSNFWDNASSPADVWVNATGWIKDKAHEISANFFPDGGIKFSFGQTISEVIEEEMSKITSGFDSSFGDLTSDVGAKSATDILEALKLELHKHFDSKDFIYLGEQIGEEMAIATNNAIVSKMKATSPLSAEIIDITAEGLDKWKAWLETRKAYDQVAQTDELAGWIRIQQMYVEGTKERMEADQEVYKLQKELVKGTYEYSKKWIDNEKYYERLSLEEELAAWERIQARYMEGSEQRIEAEKEIYRIKKELRQKDYEDAKKWIEQEKKYERLSLADELAAYLRIRKTTTEGSDERLEMDEKVYELQKQIYEAEQQYIKDVADTQKEAAEERVRLEQEYANKVKEINEKLASDIAQLNEDYANQVDQRKKSLYSAYGLFDAVEQQDYDKDELMRNLEDQVRAFEEWQMTINTLAARGLDKALIDELTEMGPSAAGQIRALNDMTDAELGQYNLLWSEKSMLAREQAVSELEELRIQTSDNIAKLQQESAKELDEYRKTWADNMAKITSDCEEKLAQLKKDFGETVGTIKKDTEGKMREMTETANRILREAGWTETGEQIVNGVISGINKNKSKLALAVGALATLAITALNSKLKINSPSKVTEETGEYVGEGLIVGIQKYYDRAWETGNKLGEEIQNGAFEAIKYVNNLMENGMDSSVTITPVFDLTNVRSGIGDMQSMLDASRAVNLATSANVSLDQSRDFSFINPNEKVVQELQNMRKDLGKLGEQVASMQLVMDTGAVVGEITAPLDAALGSRIVRNTRERG